MSAKDKLREQQQNYLDLCLADEPYRRVTVGDKSNARVELAQLRAELAALRARLAALENDIVCAFCGAHYHADDVPPQHYLTCEASPLVQRIAEQARALAEAREVLHDIDEPDWTLSKALRALKSDVVSPDETIWREWLTKQADSIDAYLSAHPAPEAEPQP